MADGIKKILFSRMTLLAAVLLVMFAIVLLRFYHLQVNQGESYQQQLEDNLTRERPRRDFGGPSMTGTGRCWPTTSWFTR